MKRLSRRELEAMRRAHRQNVKDGEQIRLKAYRTAESKDRLLAVSRDKIELLQRERSELVRALHAIASHCTKARATVSPVYGREEVFPKKVEPWLSLTYDAQFVCSPKKRARSRGLLTKTLPFNGAGKVLLAELTSLVEQQATNYIDQSRAISSIKSSNAELEQSLEEKARETEEITEVVDMLVDEVREGNRQRQMDDELPSTSGCTERTKLNLIYKQLKAFNSRFEEVSNKCNTFETTAVELEFYAKLHGKLVQQAVYEHSLSASGKAKALA